MPQYLISVWHDDDYAVDFSSDRGPAQRRPGRRLQRRDRAPAPGCSAPACSRLVGHRRARPGRPGLDDRRPLRRDQGADGRLLGHRGPRPRRRPRLGRARPPPPARARSRSARCRMADDLGDIFRREAGRCTATLIRVLGDVDLAEDAVAEAFAIAAERWPVDRACRRTPAAGSPPPPATGPSTACAGSRPARPPPRRPPTPRTTTWNPTTTPSSTTSTTSSTSSPTTSCA